MPEKKSESGIPGVGGLDGVTRSLPMKGKKGSKKAKDSLMDPTFDPFWTPGKYIGNTTAYGGGIPDNEKLFYSTREPVGVWWVSHIANDIWDNWFRVKSVENPDDPKLNNDVQAQMNFLKARVQLPRETIFERRYGTSILVLGYTGAPGDEKYLETPLFEPKIGEKPPKIDQKLLQITPYPVTSGFVNITEVEEDPSSLRRGLPLFYDINIGAGSYDSASIPVGKTSTSTVRVHWTRVIHDAPRLDEHPYLGLSALDGIMDDLYGGRNARWGMYQGYYRNGQGFPKITTKGTKKENESWITGGGVEDTLNARGYFVCGEGEDISFVGSLGQALNPTSYFDTYFTFISAGTGVAKDTIMGVSAGRVTGSEVNERQYFKSISSQQSKKEPMLRELIDRLIQAGQVEFDGEYLIEWIDPFQVNPQDAAAMEFLKERTNVLRGQTEHINEIRARKGMKPLPGEEGKRLVSMPGQFGGGLQTQGGPPNQEEPSEQPTEPESTSSGDEKSLFEKVSGEEST